MYVRLALEPRATPDITKSDMYAFLLVVAYVRVR